MKAVKFRRLIYDLMPLFAPPFPTCRHSADPLTFTCRELTLKDGGQEKDRQWFLNFLLRQITGEWARKTVRGTPILRGPGLGRGWELTELAGVWLALGRVAGDCTQGSQAGG